MKKNNNFTTEQIKFIQDNYGKQTAVYIAKCLDVSVNRVYHYAQDNNLTKPLHPVFEITDFQEQIILGGILGDGSFKKNGSNYYYRECHATPEAEYLQWKFNALYNLTTKRIYEISARKETQNAQVGFQTVNSPSFDIYAKMTIDDVISKIDDLGLMIWMLDDGWIRRNSKSCSYGVSAASFSSSQIDKMIKKLSQYGLDAHIIGSKKDLALNGNNNKKIKELMYKYFPCELDIIIKKVNDLKG